MNFVNKELHYITQSKIHLGKQLPCIVYCAVIQYSAHQGYFQTYSLGSMELKAKLYESQARLQTIRNKHSTTIL